MGVVSRIMNAANEFGSVKSKIVERKSTIGGMPIGGRNYVRFSVDPQVIKKITCWASRNKPQIYVYLKPVTR